MNRGYASNTSSPQDIRAKGPTTKLTRLRALSKAEDKRTYNFPSFLALFLGNRDLEACLWSGKLGAQLLGSKDSPWPLTLKTPIEILC